MPMNDARRFHVADLELIAGRGLPEPFGCERYGEVYNFAFYAPYADGASVVLFASGAEEPLADIPLDPVHNRTGDVWHIAVLGLEAGFRYGYRLEGAWDPANGMFHGRNTVLVDPYARAITGGALWGNPLVRRGGRTGPFRYLRRCFLPSTHFDWQGDRPPLVPLSESVIYELHVRGFTRHPSSGVAAPGTYRGLIEKIPHLVELGVTAVELMPINEFDEEGNSFFNPFTGERLKAYWGYNPFAFFAPKASYAATGIEGRQVEEFKELVRELHKAGIEVLLDVVFNHTGEGGAEGPVFSFRGFADDVYYMKNAAGEYMNYSGCGNTVNCNHPLLRRLIVDCLRYWVVELHVDGFRFDLASILGRDRDGHPLKNPPVLEEIAHDPILSRTKIIAEAWDAAGLYQVGSFPAWGRWAEWNGRFRDDVRRFLRGDGNTTGVFATRLTGSSDLYQGSGRKPWHSINFITSHDGFTLADLVAFSEKHNWANGEQNRDGDNNNLSANWGEEGPSGDPRVLRLRHRAVRNCLVSLFFSQGTPMLLAGDEFLRSQQGNNNAYCQDNELSWIDWSLREGNAGFYRFCRKLIAFRKGHATLRREDFFGASKEDGGLPEISWHGTDGGAADFTPESRVLAVRLGADGNTPVDIYLVANMAFRVTRFTLPAPGNNKEWRHVIDTAAASPADFLDPENERAVTAPAVLLRPFSMQVLVARSL